MDGWNELVSGSRIYRMGWCVSLWMDGVGGWVLDAWVGGSC